MNATLYIVRHGNTFDKGDVVTRVGGRTDLPLSVSGRRQTEALAEHFAQAGAGFASIRSSPLKRTRATAEAIRGHQPDAPEIVTDLFLREIDYGPDENRPEPEVVARIGPAALNAWELKMIPPPGWHVDPQALIGNWQELFAKLRDKPGNHLIVTSNGIARFAIAAAGESRTDAKLSTGAYGVVELIGAEAVVRAWNVRP
jgi:broad specificity phosphatase PhoE